MKLFIPIKDHSERVPRKNFRDFDQIPLYKRCLYNFNMYDIWVDTDSNEIIEGIKSDDQCKHVHVYKRPEHLIGDDVSVNLLIEHFLASIDLDPLEIICQLHVTSPFLRPKTLEDAKKLLLSFDTPTDTTVAGCNEYKSRFWKSGWANSSIEPINHNPMELIKTQDLPSMYEENSTFYMFTVTHFYARYNRMGYNPQFLQVAFPENIDIDTEEDWTIANVILRGLKCSD